MLYTILTYIYQWMFGSSELVIYSIEGNIGAGKTVLFNELRRKLRGFDYCFIEEPLDVWEQITDTTGRNILECFYEDKHKYAMTMQITALITRYERIYDAMKNGARNIIIERSLDCDHYVFASALHDEGYIDDVSWEAYKKWNDIFTSRMPAPKIIYLDTPPDVCMERIRLRDRAGEANVTLELIEKYDLCHRKWLSTVRRTRHLDLLNVSHNDTFFDQIKAVIEYILW